MLESGTLVQLPGGEIGEVCCTEGPDHVLVWTEYRLKVTCWAMKDIKMVEETQADTSVNGTLHRKPEFFTGGKAVRLNTHPAVLELIKRLEAIGIHADLPTSIDLELPESPCLDALTRLQSDDLLVGAQSNQEFLKGQTQWENAYLPENRRYILTWCAVLKLAAPIERDGPEHQQMREIWRSI